MKMRSDWSTSEVEKHLAEISSLLGNFFLRVTSKAIQTKVASAPDPKSTLSEIAASGTYPALKELLATLEALGTNVKSSMDNLEVADAIDYIMFCLKQVSAPHPPIPPHCQRILKTLLYYSQANGAMTALSPWASDPMTTHASYIVFLETLRVTGICLQPFVPGTAGRLLDALGAEQDRRTWEFTKVGLGRTINDVTPTTLFRKVKSSGTG